jgi:ElaB/YqjD/DUF883 family membrane-anchored ribosome-binding protein
MSDIHYDFHPNGEALRGVTKNLDDIEEVRGDIKRLFDTLDTVYAGQGADALRAAHVKVDGMLDEAVNNTLNTQRQAQDQQDVMQALDRANSFSF